MAPSYNEDLPLSATPLLSPSSSPSSSLSWVKPEVKRFLRLCGPMILVNLFVTAIQTSSVMFVGHLDELSLARATIATSFSNVVGISLLTGMATAMDTLCGQAFGARKYSLLASYLEQGLVALNMAAIPFAIIYAFVGYILQALGQDPQISIGAGYYMRYLIPGLFGVATSQPLFRYLLAQSLVIPVLLCAFATVVWHLTMCYVLVYVALLGYEGAAITTSTSFWVFSFLLAAYVRYSKSCEKCRAPFSWAPLKDMKAFLQLAIPSGAMICLEWWCFELIVLIAGLLPNPQLQASALSVCINTGMVLFQIPFGIGIAASTRVSNELGNGDSVAARRAIKVAMGLAISEALTLSIIIAIFHDSVGRIFSSEPEVIAYVSNIAPLLSINVFLDATQGALSGVARGCGFQRFGALINLGSYYIIGLPIGCLVGFLTPLEGQGLWLAGICAPFIQALCMFLLIAFTNWDKLVLEVADRLSSKKKPLLLDSNHAEVC